MAFSDNYRQQVALLLQTIPFVAREESFALKGGTAINLFIRDLPRLSVDIDLTYLPVLPRQESLVAIDQAMKRICERVERGIKGSRITTALAENAVTKLFIRQRGVQIKVEVTPVMRGCVYAPQMRRVSPSVEEMFGFAEMNIVSFPDLYAGKSVAALDRQHPRDLFDIRALLANEGIDDALRAAFIVYLISHNRPMAEVLATATRDISDQFISDFAGMTAEPVEKGDLIAAREKLKDVVVGGMPEEHRNFLVSFEAGRPQWDLLGVAQADQLPAVKWRQENLARLPQKRRLQLVADLEPVLGQTAQPA